MFVFDQLACELYWMFVWKRHCSPIFSHLAGKTSVWKAISAEVLQASFNTTPEMEQLFRFKRLDSEIFFAPPSSN